MTRRLETSVIAKLLTSLTNEIRQNYRKQHRNINIYTAFLQAYGFQETRFPEYLIHVLFVSSSKLTSFLFVFTLTFRMTKMSTPNGKESI